MPPSSVTLADYQGALRRLLHDANDVIWSLLDKTSYINEAIQQRDLDTGGQRALVTFALTAGTNRYTFSDLQTSGTFADGPAATANIFDVLSITLIYVGYRIVLDEMAYSEMVSKGYLAYTSTTDRPGAWCRRGPNAVLLGPVPAQAYSTEWDVACYSVPALLANTTDVDTMVFPYTYPVPLYAAYLAKQNERKYDEAGFFLDRYQRAITQINSAKVGMAPTMYPTNMGR